MALFVVLSDPGGLNLNWILALVIALARGRGDRPLHRILRRAGRHSVIRRDAGSVPRLPGPAAAHHRSRRSLPDHSRTEILAIQNSNLPAWEGWVMLVIILVISAGSRRSSTVAGAPAPACRTARSLSSGSSWRSSLVVGGVSVVAAQPEPRPGELPQRQDRRRNRHRGRADRGADRAGDPLDRNVRARPHPVRPLPLRDRRQRRGSTPRRYQGHRHQVGGVRDLLDPCRGVRSVQRIEGPIGGCGIRTRHRAERYRGGGRRRRQPLRWTRTPHARGDRRPGDRGHHERPRPAQPAVAASTSSSPAAC